MISLSISTVQIFKLFDFIFIGDISDHSLFSDWPTHQFGLDEVTHHFIVKILDGHPFDSLLNIFFLQTENNMAS